MTGRARPPSGAALAATAIAVAGCTCQGGGAAAPADAARAGARPAADAAADRPERVVVTQVATSVVDPETPRQIYPRILAQKLGRALAESPWFYSAAQRVPPAYRPRRAGVELSITYDVSRRSGELAVVAAVTAELAFARTGADLAVRENVLAERPVPAGEAKNLDGIVAVHIEDAVMAAAEGLVAREAIRSGPPARALEAIEAGEPALASWALEVAGDRRLARAQEPAEAALASEHDAVRSAAIRALVALGDPRSVPALTALAEFQDHELMRTLLEAVTALGGDEARAFLEFVATGHPDADLERRAREGLERLERRSPRGR